MDIQVVHHQVDLFTPRDSCARPSPAPGQIRTAERLGVGRVKCRPAFGSTAQKTLAVPVRSKNWSVSRKHPQNAISILLTF